MNGHDPVVRAYVEALIFDLLESLRKSIEMQDRYQPLSPRIKRASTDELRRMSQDSARYILDHVEEIDDFAHIADSGLMREALLRSIPDDDR